jgi:hypothetical protein
MLAGCARDASRNGDINAVLSMLQPPLLPHSMSVFVSKQLSQAHAPSVPAPLQLLLCIGNLQMPSKRHMALTLVSHVNTALAA